MMKIIVICGPTGIGKTSFAISLARQFKGEIIGADSMQVYRHMDIGTAKPEPAELRQVPHHLVGVIDPRDPFDAGQYVTAADAAIADIVQRNRLPMIVGGTGLYIRALLNGLFRTASACDDTLSGLTRELSEKGPMAVYQQLVACDPAAAEKIHPNDSFRVLRALEVFMTTGQKISDRHHAHGFGEQRYKSLKIGLTMDRDILYERINHRVDRMLDQGLLHEVVSLHKQGYSFDLKPMQSIGYKHMAMFINGQADWEEAVRLLKRDTRRYAKRQFTWFGRDPEMVWLKPSEREKAQKMIKEFLT